MHHGSAHLTIDGIDVEVVRKRIKNVNLAVYPPHGRVRVSAPHRLGDAAVRRAVESRIGWIRRQQERLRRPAPEATVEPVDGETHSVWGRRIPLQVVAGSTRNRGFLAGDTSLVVHVREASAAEVERTLDDWDRSQLTNAIPSLIGRWAPIIDVEVHAWGIRKMSTRWGSCNPEAHRISLNLELARERPEYLEYVVIHEMVHIREPRHDRRFELLMDRFLPDWRTRRRELNHGPKTHATRVSEEPAGV